MEHIGVGDEHTRLLADGGAMVLRGVAVVGAQGDGGLQRRDPLLHRGDLVVGQRLGGKEQQRRGSRVVQERVEQGQRVAQRLAGSGTRSEDDVLAVQRGFDGAGLVGVERVDAQAAARRRQARVQACGPGGGVRHAGRQRPPRRHVADEARVGSQCREQIVKCQDHPPVPGLQSPAPNRLYVAGAAGQGLA